MRLLTNRHPPAIGDIKYMVEELEQQYTTLRSKVNELREYL
jgi:hypothetical protein